MDKIRLMLVDDHAMVRQGLHLLLGTQSDFEIIGEAADAREAVELARTTLPDVILMDINLPGRSGIAATYEITRLGLPTRILGLSAHEDQAFLKEMLKAGASGYVLKDATGDELISAIRLVHKGGVYISSSMAPHLGTALAATPDPERSGRASLTPRELEVLILLGRGLTYHAVAERLGVSVNTVASHRTNIMRKLGIETKEQLVEFALKAPQL